MKKILCFLLTLLLCAGALCGCGVKSDTPPQGETPSEDDNKPSADLTRFRTVFEGDESKEIAAGGNATFAFSVALTEENYFALDYTSTQVVRGSILYTTAGGSSDYEDFWSTAGEQSVRQIVDFFCLNAGNKTLTGIKFYNLGDQAAAVTLKKVQVCKHGIEFSGVRFDRPQEVEDRMQLFLTGKSLKLGVTLKSGGCVNWLSQIDGTVGLAKTAEGNVYVGKNASRKGEVLTATDVNLINTRDNGRFVQQSYYGILPGDEYKGGTFGALEGGTAPRPWAYNPVQGGDCKNNCSQLADVRVSENEIYVKARPMDWALSNRITKAYMENRYTLKTDENGNEYVEVENRFTDFSGYNHNNVRAQELPAFYGISPLGTAVYAAAVGAELTRNDHMEFWDGNQDARLRCPENWFGWVNEEDWGVGLYVPQVVSVLAGRTGHTLSYNELTDAPHKAVSSTYAAPLGNFSLVTYEPFAYTYYLATGQASELRALFVGMDTQNANAFLQGKEVW